MFNKKFQEWVMRGFGATAPSGKILLLILRGMFVALVISIATGALYYYDLNHMFADGLLVFGMVLFIGVVTVSVDVLAKNKQITTISALYFGLLMGFLLGTLLWMALEPIFQIYLRTSRDQPDLERLQFARLFITLICCYVCVSTLIQTKDEFRFITPYVEFSKKLKGAKPLVLDTSVIIDGRIADICDTGIIDTKLIVPVLFCKNYKALRIARTRSSATEAAGGWISSSACKPTARWNCRCMRQTFPSFATFRRWTS